MTGPTNKRTGFKLPDAKAANADAWIDAQPDRRRGSRSAPAPEPELPEKSSRLTVDLPTSTHNKFKSICALQDRKMSSVITEMVERYIKENK